MTTVQIDYSFKDKPLPVVDNTVIQQNWPTKASFTRVGELPIAKQLPYEYANHEASDAPIKLFTLGRFSILGNNNYLDFTGKGQRKSLELLKTLIAMGGREVGELRISEALWPDSEGDVAHSTFAVTLHRLRKLLGPNALILSEGRLTLNPKYCWVDVWALDRLFGETKNLIFARNQDCLLIKYVVNEIIKLYHGPYLGFEDEQAWFLSYRDKLHAKYLSSLQLVCNYLEKTNQHELCIELYEKGLEIDDLSEKFYLKLMQCYYNLGFYSAAIQVYERCQRILSAHYGVTPSHETQSVYNAVRKYA